MDTLVIFNEHPTKRGLRKDGNHSINIDLVQFLLDTYASDDIVSKDESGICKVVQSERMSLVA